VKYEGPIYGVGRNFNGRKIYFDTGRTSQEWDAMETKIVNLERENAALREAGHLAEKIIVQRTDEIRHLESEIAALRAANETLRAAITAARPKEGGAT
jgi:uncharacterized protein YaaN involved in tellurite resistance